MRQLIGLERFLINHTGFIKPEQVAQYMQTQFKESHLLVYAEPLGEQKTLLADLTIINDQMNYDLYQQRLELVFIGTVIDEKIPLTYTIHGQDLSYLGRCSVIPKVCGVDLYFANYVQSKGQKIRQKIIIPIKDLVKQLKKIKT